VGLNVRYSRRPAKGLALGSATQTAGRFSYWPSIT
jgi:hypothetical protein